MKMLFGLTALLYVIKVLNIAPISWSVVLIPFGLWAVCFIFVVILAVVATFGNSK